MGLPQGDGETTTAADILTDHHRYTGSVVNSGYRLSDLLRDPHSDLLEMRETLISSRRTTAKVPADRIFVRKSEILLVIPSQGHEAPDRRVRCYRQTDRFAVTVVLPGYIVSGDLHLAPRADPQIVLYQDAMLPSFLGMTDLTVHASTHGWVPAQCKVAILNRRRIESLQLGEQRWSALGESLKAKLVAIGDVGWSKNEDAKIDETQEDNIIPQWAQARLTSLPM